MKERDARSSADFSVALVWSAFGALGTEKYPQLVFLPPADSFIMVSKHVPKPQMHDRLWLRPKMMLSPILSDISAYTCAQ